MEAPAHIARKKTRRSKRTKWLLIGAIITVIVIIAIAVPAGVLLNRGGNKEEGLSSNAIIPLYIYPLAGAWDDMFKAVTARPSLNFTVIINPASGPGDLSYPGDDYVPHIQKLNTYSNVRTVGYVRTGYGSREIRDVLQDVRTYSGWGQNSSANSNSTAPLAVHGIFFDEAPSEGTPENVRFMRTINDAAKNASGILADRIIIHNPGIIPDPEFNDPSTDITVVFENSYQNYSDLQPSLKSLDQDRSQYSYMVHSVPEDTNVGEFVDDISHEAEYLFLTERTKDFYSGFGSQWMEFINAIPS